MDNKNSISRIMFTLPISCQICLGKIKNPVICPNQHAFCSVCIEIWLEHNQQCPACRVDITDEKPCKQVIGGLNLPEADDPADSFLNKKLRKARVELLFKDYEHEIENLQTELSRLTDLNTVLNEKLNLIDIKSNSKTDLNEAIKKSNDLDMLINLTKRIQQSQAMNDKYKGEMSKLKKRINEMKDEHAAADLENQRLKSEMDQRSPMKYSRYTVAILESKLEKCEKEKTQLHNALISSDKFVESLQKELEETKKNLKSIQACPSCEKLIKGLNDVKNAIENNESFLSLNDHCNQEEKTTKIMSVMKHQQIDMSDTLKMKSKLNSNAEQFYGRSPKKSDCNKIDLKSDLTPSKNIKTLLTFKKPDNFSSDDSFVLEAPSPSRATDDRMDNMYNGCDNIANLNDTIERCSKKLKFDSIYYHDSNSLSKKDPYKASDISETILNKNEFIQTNHDLISVTSKKNKTGFDDNLSSEVIDCLKFIDHAEKKVAKENLS